MRLRKLPAAIILLILNWTNPVLGRDAEFGEALANTSPFVSTTTPIPKIVHFIFGLVLGAGDFDFPHYLAVKSAYDVIKPDQIYFWMHYDLKGQWWEAARELVTVRRIDLIDTVYGHPIHHFAHRADVLRLKVLHEFGGIYLDMDVISLKSFDDILQHNFVLGEEGVSGEIGLCNGVILSQPRAPFLRRWMASYQSFDGLVWAWHSVAIPNYLSKIHPSEIHIMDHQAFFAPLWNEAGLQKMYMEKTYDFSNNYAVHLWESNARKWFLDRLTPDLASAIDLPLFCEMRRFINATGVDQNSPACRLAKRNAYTDGTVAWYSFEQDANEQPRVEDALANHLHGWALNGTLVTKDSQRAGNVRKFRGQGDFVILPALETTYLQDFTLQMHVKFAEVDQPAASVLALQSEEFTILIEGYMSGKNHKLWLKAFQSLQPEEQLLWNMEAHDHYYYPDEWFTLTLRANSTSQRLELFADTQMILGAKWPPQGAPDKLTVKNIWLGARPASPFPDDHRKEANNDFVGSMDDIIIWDRPVNAKDILTAANDPSAMFRRHMTLLKHQRESASIQIEVLSQEKGLVFWQDRRSGVSAQATLPLSLEKIWPRQEDEWRLSWVMHLREKFVSAGTPPSGIVWSADDDLLGVLFSKAEYLGVTYDTATGQLLLRQYGFAFPSIRRTDSTKACSLAAGFNQSLALTLEVNKTENSVSLHCGNLRILHSTMLGLNKTGQPLLSHLDRTRVDVTKVQLDLGRVVPTAFSRSLDELFVDKPAFTVRVGDTVTSVEATTSRKKPIRLASGALAKLPVTISVEKSIISFSIQPRIDLHSDCAFLTRVPVVSAVPLGQNRYQLEAENLHCEAYPDCRSDVELHIPELFGTFIWRLECDQLPAYNTTLESNIVQEQPSRIFDDRNLGSPIMWLCLAVFCLAALWKSRQAILRVLTRFTTPAIQLAPSPVMTKEKVEDEKAKTGAFYRHFSKSLSRRHLFFVAASMGALFLLWRLTNSSVPATNMKFGLVPNRLAVKQQSAPHLRPRPVHSAEINSSIPTFSIITPCYGQAQWLPEVHRYLQQQTYPWFQWIIVNDGSPDDCLSVALSLQAQDERMAIKVIDKPQGGLADARNTGIAEASSPWICLLDADDGLDALYLELAAGAIRADPTVTAVNADQRFFGDSDWLWELPIFNRSDMLYRGQFPVQTIFRKHDWLQIGGFEPTLPWGNEDWSFWISLSHLPGFKVHKLANELILYRYKAKSMQREKETYKEVVPMMMTLHPDKYSQSELLLAHSMVGRFIEPTTIALVDKLSSEFPSRRAPLLWKGIIAEQQGNWKSALDFYHQASAADVSRLDWQPAYRAKVVRDLASSSKAYYGM